MLETSRLESLTAEVAAVAKEVGQFILNERRNFAANKVEVKGHNDFVSYVDKESDKRIVLKLKETIH